MSVTEPIKELIRKTEVQKEALRIVLMNPLTIDRHEIEKLQACICFIDGFKTDLESLL